MFDLGTIESPPFQVKSQEGIIYEIEDPGVEAIMKLINLAASVEKDQGKFKEFLSHFRMIIKSLPDEIFNNLSSKQLVKMMHAMGKHFLSQEKEGEAKGPLPSCG